WSSRINFDRKFLPPDILAVVAGPDNAESLVLGRRELTYLLPFDMWQFQKHCQKALEEPEKWLTEVQKLFPALVARRQYPHFGLTVVGCQEALRTTITIDILKNVRFRLCARHDCRTPFPVETRHQREYCCQYCAHLESVRRQRQPRQEQR